MDLSSCLTPKCLPLVKTAAIKIAIWLWYNEDIRHLEYPIQKRTKKRVAAKIGRLNISSEKLQRQLEDVVGPIGDHLGDSMRSLDGDGSLLNQLNWPELISWKANGTIDTRKTAEGAIRTGALTEVQAFRLAASNCMVDQLFRLWPTLNACDAVVPWDYRGMGFAIAGEEVEFWIAYLAKDAAGWLDFNNERYWRRVPGPQLMTKFGFTQGLRRGNEEFCLYHMDRLNEIEKEGIVLEVLQCTLDNLVILCINPSLFHRIVCQMSAGNRTDLFEEHPCGVLTMLLQWPLQDYFLAIACEIQQLLSDKDFAYVLHAAARKAYEYDNSETYRNIFVDFWKGAIVNQREYFISDWVFARFLDIAFDKIGRRPSFIFKMFESFLKVSMLHSGHLVFDVIMGHCYLKILETVTVKYFRRSFAVILIEIQTIVKDRRKSHRSCSNFCSPLRFDRYLLSEKRDRISSHIANAQIHLRS